MGGFMKGMFSCISKKIPTPPGDGDIRGGNQQGEFGRQYGKRLFALFLVFIMCVSLLPISAFADEPGEWLDLASALLSGSGSEEDPYLVATAADLAYIAKQTNYTGNPERFENQYFKLVADIDLSANYWTPIGVYDTTKVNNQLPQMRTFMGIFDGDGHTITDLTIPANDASHTRPRQIALFGNNGGTIKNLNVSGSIIQSTSSLPASPVMAAGIAAYNSGSIRDCVSAVDILIKQTTLNNVANVGGIVGYGAAGSTIERCINRGDIVDERTSSLNSYAGGIMGYSPSLAVAGEMDTRIIDCDNEGDIKFRGIIGGIAGYIGSRYHAGNGILQNAMVERCSNSGNLTVVNMNTGNTYLGGIVGVLDLNEYGASIPTEFYGSTVKDSYNTGNVTVSGTTGTSVYYAGGIVGYSQGSGLGHKNILNTYTTGTVNLRATNAGAVVGYMQNYDDGTIASNVYYLEGIAQLPVPQPVGAGFAAVSKTDTELRSSDFATLLNSGTTGDIFTAASGGYPIFSRQAGNLNAPIGLSVSGDSINGLHSGNSYEYRNVSDTTWTAVQNGATSISGLASGNYYVRVKGDTHTLPSMRARLAVPGAIFGTLQIDGVAKFNTPLGADLLNAPFGAAQSYQWAYSDTAEGEKTEISGAVGRFYIPTADDIGKFFAVTVTASGYTGTLSTTFPAAVVKADAPAAPAGLAGVPESIAGEGGKITGLLESYLYEYRISTATDDDYITVEEGSTEITGLEPATYRVRLKETATTLAGSTVNITVAAPLELSGTLTVTWTQTAANANAGAETPKNGDTLTASVTGAPEGAVLKYQWKRAASPAAAKSNISGATQANYPVTINQVAYYAVTVTAAGYGGELTANVGETVSKQLTTLRFPHSAGLTVTIRDSNETIIGSLTTPGADYDELKFVGLDNTTYKYSAMEKSTLAAWGTGTVTVSGENVVKELAAVDFTAQTQTSGSSTGGYSVALTAYDGETYTDGGRYGHFLVPSAPFGARYDYAFSANNTPENFWGSAGTFYQYPTKKINNFYPLNLSDDGKFYVTPKKALSIAAPEGAELHLYHRVKFYQPLEEISAKTQSTENGITTYSYDAPGKELHYELTMPGYVKKAAIIQGATTTVDIPLSSLTADTNTDIPDASGLAANILINAPDSKYIEMQQGEKLELYLFRVWQASNSITGNYYVDPTYKVEVISGDSVTVTDPYYAGATINAVKDGISFVRVTYGPLDFVNTSGNSQMYSKLFEENTAILVFNVNREGTAEISSGISLGEYDTVYYTRSVNGASLAPADQYAEYTFTPSVSGSSITEVAIRAPIGSTQAWSDSWTPITADNGSYTAKLSDGRSIVRITAEDGSVIYHSIKARGLDITATNAMATLNDRKFTLTATASQSVQLTFSGLELPQPKLAAIYNPGYPDKTYLVYTLKNAGGTTIAELESTHTQYGIATTNDVTVSFHGETGNFKLVNGAIHTSAIGEGGGAHRNITKGGMIGAQSYTGGDSGETFNGLFCILPDLNITVIGSIQNVIDLINAIGTVDQNSGPAITAARAAYDALSAEDQAQVINYSTLTDAEAALAAIIQNSKTPIITQDLSTAAVNYNTGDTAAALEIASSIGQVGTVSYQWYSKAAGASDFTPVDGANSNSYTPSTATAGTTYYKVVVKNTLSSVDYTTTSAIALIIVTQSYTTQTNSFYPTTGLTFDIGGKTIAGYVDVSFVDYGVRINNNPDMPTPLGNIIAATQVPYAQNETVAEVTLRLLAALGIEDSHTGTTTGDSFYLQAIKNFKQANGTLVPQLGEYDAGSQSGWMITLNDEFINRGASQFTVANGDSIEWQYTCQLGADIGGGANDPGEPEYTTANVWFQQNAGGFVLADKSLEIAPGLSEEYGYEDEYNGLESTALDALVAAHIALYGEDEEVIQDKLVLSESGFVTKILGISTSGFIFYINGVMPGDGIYVEDTFNGGTSQTGYSVAQALLEEGDDVSFVLVQDLDAYADLYSWFEKDGQKTAAFTVAAGTDFDLEIKGYYGMWYGLSDSATQAAHTNPIEDAAIVPVTLADGAAQFGNPLGITGENGQATLRFDAPGTYILSAIDNSGDIPLLSPWLTVTVTEAPDEAGLLAAAKTAKLAAVDSAVAALNLTQAGYTADSWTAFQNAIAGIKAAINALTDLEAVTGYKISLAAAQSLLIADQQEPTAYETALSGALNWIRGSTPNPAIGTTGGEWAVLALARAGVDDGAWYDAYRTGVTDEVYSMREQMSVTDSVYKVILHERKYTDNSRVILALTALGEDAVDFRGYDFVSALTDKQANGDYQAVWQGVNGAAYALIALDTHNYLADNESIRGDYIAWLLAHQKPDGSWSIDGEPSGSGDFDMTAMTVQALAAYQSQEDAAGAISRALGWLSAQTVDSAESNAQMIVALSALGQDAESYVNMLLTFRDEATGAFKHMLNEGVSWMATEQAAYALVAYARYVDGANTLYDMGSAFDWTFTYIPSVQGDEVDVDAVKAAVNTAFASYSIPMGTANASADVKAQIESGIAAFSLNGVTATVTMGGFTPAVAGTASNTAGTNGSFNFTVDLSKGSAQDSIQITGVITATPYIVVPVVKKVAVSFTLMGDSKHDTPDKHTEYQTWIPQTTYTYEGVDRVLVKKVLLDALADAGMSAHIKNNGNYVSSITRNGVTLAEFDNGPNSGWMYTVNGVHVKTGLAEQYVVDGDDIVWHYVDDYKKEAGNWEDDDTPTSPVAVTPTPSVVGDKSVSLAPKATASNGAAAAAIPAADMTSAITSAKENSSAAIVIAPEITGEAKKVSVELPKASVSSVAADTAAALTVQTPVGNVTIPNSVLGTIATQAAGDNITVSLESVSSPSLTPAQQAAVGASPVYDISIVSGGKAISSFEGSSISISLPYTLKEGENPGGVTVWYLNDAGELEKMTCTYDGTTGMATFSTNHLSYYVVGYEAASAEWKNPFTDVKATDWFYKNVEFAVQKGLFSGTAADTFSPGASMTRAMLVTVLYRLEGSPAVSGNNGFTDVRSGEWYTDAVIWANAKGLVTGYGDGLFGTNDSITREQMAVILYNYAALKGYDVAGSADLKAFTDAEGISSWALEPMKWANSEGLITGRTATTLAPEGSAIRAEVAAILQRFVESFEK